jgi:hypothetical protein
VTEKIRCCERRERTGGEEIASQMYMYGGAKEMDGRASLLERGGWNSEAISMYLEIGWNKGSLLDRWVKVGRIVSCTQPSCRSSFCLGGLGLHFSLAVDACMKVVST